MTNYFVLDIETAPLPAETLAEIIPEFDADKRLKDADKIKADLQAKFDAWKDESALYAHRGKVLAVGIIADNVCTVLEGVEADILRALEAKTTEYSDRTVVGHNVLGFDIPFLCRRMWKHGIRPPIQWLDCTPWRAVWAFDTMLAWSCGNREQRISLDNLAFHLGAGRKSGDGKDFSDLYSKDKAAALAYLKNDLSLTEKCYLTMRNTP